MPYASFDEFMRKFDWRGRSRSGVLESLQMNKTVAYHEAGHAVARWLVHGSTGPVVRAPTADAQAGAESHPFPAALQKIVNGPDPVGHRYSETQAERLTQEVKTALAGCVSEGMLVGRDTGELLSEPENHHDEKTAYACAGLLNKTSTSARDKLIDDLVAELRSELQRECKAVRAIAKAFMERDLSAADVKGLILSNRP